MSEPTIDEMLAWLLWVEQGTVSDPLIPFTEDEIVVAIRAILEQHRSYPDEVEAVVDQFLEDAAGKIQQANLEAIRAFVERVEMQLHKVVHHPDVAHGIGMAVKGMRGELAAMEKENE